MGIDISNRTQHIPCNPVYSLATYFDFTFTHCICIYSGSGSSVRIANEIRAGRFGIESRWGRELPPVQTGPGAHPASCKMGTGFFPGVKCGRGVLLTSHPLLVLRSWKSKSYTSTHPLGNTGPVTGSPANAIRSPDRPARSESLYRLSYPGPDNSVISLLLLLLLILF